METLIEKLEPIKPMDIKKQHYVEQILALLRQGTTVTDIAKTMGKSRTWVYQITQDQGTQEIIKAETAELKTQLINLIQELEKSPSPQDRRTAAVEKGKMVRHMEDKTTPTLSQNTNLNITLDYNKLQQEISRHNETLRNLPPDIRKIYWDTYNNLPQTT